MNIEHEGLLYRGDDPAAPSEVWDYPRKRWVRFHEGTSAGGPGRPIDEAEADRLKVNNPRAEHFLYYDTPPWRQPVNDAYWDALATSILAARRTAAAMKRP